MKKLVLYALIIFSIDTALATSQDQSYLDFCNGKTDLISAQSNDFGSRFDSLISNPALKAEKAALEKKLSLHAELSEADRVIAASLMISARTQDLVQLRNFLKFSSTDSEIESHRLVLLAQIENLSGSSELSAELLKKALELSSGSDVSVLAQALLAKEYAAESLNSSDRILLDRIGRVSNLNPMKDYLRANYELLTNRSKNNDHAFELFRAAYQSCERDQNLAVAYAFALLSHRKVEEAQKIFEKVISENMYNYSPYVDLYLGETYLDRDMAKAESHLERARVASWYFDLKTKARLISDHERLQQWRRKNLDFWRATATILSLLIVVLIFSLGRNLLRAP